MALSPDDIQRRTFPIADWGYDRGEVHKFLAEVAAVVRYAQHRQLVEVTAVPPGAALPAEPVTEPGPQPGSGDAGAGGRPRIPPFTSIVADPPAGARASRTEAVDPGHEGAPPSVAQAAEAGPPPAADGYEVVGFQVADVLRAAGTVAENLRAETERELAEQRARAELELADRAREAEREVAASREEARRLLRVAKEQADTVVADARVKADRLMAAANERAQQRSRRAEAEARRHAERLLRFERDLDRRLHAAHDDVGRAIERLEGSEHRPVLDLTDDNPRVRIGGVDLAPADDELSLDPPPSIGDGGSPDAGGAAADPGAADPGAVDPLPDMIRAAVGRAVEASSSE